MTFKSFFEKYNGKSNIGNTTANKGECVGLVAVYIDELNLPHVWGHAMDLFANADEKFFAKILNTPEAIPQEGDIIVWGKKFNNTFGHTGIATSKCDLKTLEVFQQNDPVGSNCHLKVYKYTNITGWLRPKQGLANDDSDCQKQLAEEIVKKNETWEELQKVKAERDAAQDDYETFIQLLQIEEPTLPRIKIKIGELLDAGEKLADSLNKLNSATNRISAMSKEVEAMGQRTTILERENKSLLDLNESLSQATSKAVDSLEKCRRRLNGKYIPLLKLFNLYLCRKEVIDNG